MNGAAPTTAPQANSSSAIVEIVTDLNRQHEESSAALQRLLDLVRSAQQREALLRRELGQAQEALRTRASDLERLQAEVAALREQTTKREQAERTEEDVRQRLLQVEHYIAALTTEQQHRDATEQVHLDEQVRANESLRVELASSLSKVRELETTVQPLRDKQAELTQHLEDSQKRLADTEKRLASQEVASQKRLADTEKRLASREEEILRLQRQHAERGEADRRLISEGHELRAAHEAEARRLRQENETQQAADRRKISEADQRFADMVSTTQSTEQQHAERVAKLTVERDIAIQQHQRLLVTIGEMVPLPVGRASPFMTHAAPLKSRLKNPLVYFLEPAFARAATLEALNDNLMLFAVLFAQGRFCAMMTHIPGQAKEASSAVLVRHVVECVGRYDSLFPKEARDWAVDHDEWLHRLENLVTVMVRKQLTRALQSAAAV